VVSALGALVIVLFVAGCGSSSLSDTQLRANAARMCSAAQRRAEQISAPKRPADAVRYLSHGITALTPQVTALRALPASGDLAKRYRSAVDAVDAELRELRSAVRGLKSGNDPVVAIKTLQERLAPLERRADASWRAIDIPACVSR
jgi:hypothetical protein